MVMRHAIALINAQRPSDAGWDAFDVARTLVVALCALAYVAAGYLPAL